MATMGRRPKTEELKLSERVPINMTSAMKRELQSLATGRGVDMSDLVRELIERELADPERVIEAILGQAGRAGLEAAGYEIRKRAED